MLVPSERHPQLEVRSATLSADRSPLGEAIEQARARLLAMQDPAGFWVAELEADSTLTSEYIMLRYLLGKVDETKLRKAAAYLRDTQLPDGGWNIYYGGPSHLSTTVKAYFALKLIGHSKEEPFMRRAREVILDQAASCGPTSSPSLPSPSSASLIGAASRPCPPSHSSSPNGRFLTCMRSPTGPGPCSPP